MMILALILISTLPTSLSLRAPCQDDSTFTFGSYTWTTQSGVRQVTTRTCAWITENPSRIQQRKNYWCDKRDFVTGNNIRDVCGIACGCDQTEIKTCHDRKVGANQLLDWVDEYGDTCSFYEQNKEYCGMYGDAKGFGITAKQACCVCGGGWEVLG